MTTRSSAFAIITAGLLIAVTGCGSSEDTGAADTSDAPSASSSPSASSEKPAPTEAESSAPAEEPVVIDIADFAFSETDPVAPGATVMVKNVDPATHSVTADGGEFDLVIEGSGATGTFKAPSEPGKYSYICKFHPDMVGTLVVK